MFMNSSVFAEQELEASWVPRGIREIFGGSGSAPTGRTVACLDIAGLNFILGLTQHVTARQYLSSHGRYYNKNSLTSFQTSESLLAKSFLASCIARIKRKGVAHVN